MKITLLLILVLTSADVFALRCGNRLVDIGERKIEVIQKCGKPALVESYQIEATILLQSRARELPAERLTAQLAQASTQVVNQEEWTYNFGANSLIHFLSFSNDRLTGIEVGSRGFDNDALAYLDKSRCGELVVEGDRKIEVLRKCGQPDLEDSRVEQKTTTAGLAKRSDDALSDSDDQKTVLDQSIRYQQNRMFVSVTEWSYNFGPNHFIQFITFENGRVVKSEMGGYGFK